MALQTDVMSLLALADLSIAKGDYPRALSILRDALDMAEKTAPGDTKQRLDIQMKLVEVNHVTGQWVDALMHLDNVLRTASEKHMVNVMGEALVTSGSILSKKGNWDLAQRKFDQAIELLGMRQRHPLMAKALIGKGVILWRKGMGSEAVQNARRAIEIAEEMAEDAILGAGYALMGSASFDMGNYVKSVQYNEEALRHYRKAGDIIEATRVLNNTGETHKVMGNYSKAIEFFNEGLHLTTGKGVRRNMAYLLANLAECHMREGRNLEARTFATMSEDNARDIQDEYLHAMIRFVWGLIFEREGDFGRAGENYMAAILKMFTLGIPFDIGLMEMAYAECLLKQSKTEEARAHMADAARSLRAAGSVQLAEQAEAKLAKIS